MAWAPPLNVSETSAGPSTSTSWPAPAMSSAPPPLATTTTTRSLDRWAPWVVVIVVAACFAPVVRDGIAPIDDPQTIFGNRRLNPPRWTDPDGVPWYWGHAELGLYMPVTYTV